MPLAASNQCVTGIRIPVLQRDDELAGSLSELISWLFCEPNPIPL